MAKTINAGFLSDKVNGITINSVTKCNKSNYKNTSSRKTSYVVMHYTGNIKDSAVNNAKYFANNSNIGSSAHFFVDEKNICQSVELQDEAWHCGCSTGYKTACRNSNSIGIEMCTSGNYRISGKTKENAAYLCAHICKLLGIAANEVDAYVLRHYDVVKTNKKCPSQMVDNPDEWDEFKDCVRAILNGAATPPTPAAGIATKKTPFQVKVTDDALNIRTGAGTNYKAVGCIKDNGVYTITETSGNWGKLKSGAGWISISTKYVKYL